MGLLHSVSPWLRRARRLLRSVGPGTGTEADEQFLTNAYGRTLGREMDAAGAAHYLDAMRNGASAADVERSLAASEEAAELPTWWNAADDDEQFVERIYREYLRRDPDEEGRRHFLNQVRSVGRRAVAREMEQSREHVNGRSEHAAMEAFHFARVEWIKSLPPARRILDLGGTALNDRRGAMLVMGYPHNFEELSIIELPPENRHDLYRVPEHDDLDTPQGAVHYLYRSMCDLDDLPDASYDLVVSAQTFEHITREEGVKLLKDVRRLVTPEGAFAIDTPNRALTAITCNETGAEWINPDHKYEYTDGELRDLLEGAGWRIESAVGIGHMPKTIRTGQWWMDDLLDSGLTDKIGESFTSAFLARPATEAS